jgi:hypothetical protein
MAGKKSKKFRVATSGPTIDGREISPQHLREMAATYNPALYTGRVFVEHIRGLSADSFFPACGDVLDLEARDENGGVALYATIEANAELLKINKADQKVFTSVEIVANFAGTGKAYLGGLAITDTPASLGTERISFSANVQRETGSGVFASQGDGVTIEFEGGPLEELKNWITSNFTAKTPAPAPAPAPAPDSALAPAPAPQPQQFSAQDIAAAVAAQLAPGLQQGFSAMAKVAEDQSKATDALAGRVAAMEAHNATTDSNPSQRPVANGGGGEFII